MKLSKIVSNEQYHQIHVILKDFHIDKNKLCLKKINIFKQNILFINRCQNNNHIIN